MLVHLRKKSPRAGDRVVTTPTLGLIPGTPEGKGLKHKQKDDLEQPNGSEIAKFTFCWVARRITELTNHTGIFNCSTLWCRPVPRKGVFTSVSSVAPQRGWPFSSPAGFAPAKSLGVFDSRSLPKAHTND